MEFDVLTRGVHVFQAWILWMQVRPLELINNALRELCALFEVLRCINVALLCVQRRPEDRPSMSTVVLMLGGESILPQPKQPGFFLQTLCRRRTNNQEMKSPIQR